MFYYLEMGHWAKMNLLEKHVYKVTAQRTFNVDSMLIYVEITS